MLWEIGDLLSVISDVIPDMVISERVLNWATFVVAAGSLWIAVRSKKPDLKFSVSFDDDTQNLVFTVTNIGGGSVTLDLLGSYSDYSFVKRKVQLFNQVVVANDRTRFLYDPFKQFGWQTPATSICVEGQYVYKKFLWKKTVSVDEVIPIDYLYTKIPISGWAPFPTEEEIRNMIRLQRNASIKNTKYRRRLERAMDFIYGQDSMRPSTLPDYMVYVAEKMMCEQNWRRGESCKDYTTPLGG